MLYFSNVNDFATTVVKIHALTFIGGFTTAFIGFVTGYIYDDLTVVTTLILVLFADLVTGIYASFIQKCESEGKQKCTKTFILAIQSRKLLRSFISILFHFLLLSVSFHISRSQVIFSFLPGFIVGAVFATQFVSIAENLYKAKVIQGRMLDLIVNRMDFKRINQQADQAGAEEAPNEDNANES